MRETPSPFTDLRLRWAAALGASADEPQLVIGGASAYRIAAGRENVDFLRRGARYTAREHRRDVFERACAAGLRAVVSTLKELHPELDCDLATGRSFDPRRPPRRAP